MSKQVIEPSLQPCMPQAATISDEKELRVQLAAVYRLIDQFQMSDLIDTHISARLPGSGSFLLNPFGMMFHEITSSNLVKVDFKGHAIDSQAWSVNPAVVIHSAILSARPDVNCVLHTHSRYGTAVSMLECGLLPASQFALMFYNRVADHDYEGVVLDLAEQERLVKDLGNKDVMILRNHGLLTVGRTIAEAFILMFYLEKACEAQILAQSTGSPLIIPSEEVCQAAMQGQDSADWRQLQWNALVRLLEQDPSYRA